MYICAKACMYEAGLNRSSSWYFKTLESMSSKQMNSGIVQAAERQILTKQAKPHLHTQ